MKRLINKNVNYFIPFWQGQAFSHCFQLVFIEHCNIVSYKNNHILSISFLKNPLCFGINKQLNIPHGVSEIEEAENLLIC